MTTEATVTDIINNALLVAQEKQELVDIWANNSWFNFNADRPVSADLGIPGIKFNGETRNAELQSISNAVAGIESLPELDFPNEIVIPKFTTYGAVEGGDPTDDPIVKIINELNDFSVQYGMDALGPKLIELFTAFLNTYFPAFLPPEMAIENLQDILDNAGYTLPVPAEDAVYQRGRDRVMEAGLQAEEDAIAQWSSRGFPMPPGALLNRLEQVRQDTQNKVSQVTSDIVVKQADLAVDMYKFAIEQAIEYRMKAVQAAVEYIKVFTSAVMRQFGADSYAAILNAKNQMAGTSIDLYKTMMGIRELRAKLAAGDRDLTVDAWKGSLSVDSELLRARASASIGAANAVGNVAAAALSSLVSMANLTNISTS